MQSKNGISHKKVKVKDNYIQKKGYNSHFFVFKNIPKTRSFNLLLMI